MHEFLRGARVYDLEQPRYEGAPSHPAHAPGFVLSLHRRHERIAGERRTSASALLTMAEHSGTHIDALCHQAVDMRLHGGVEVEPSLQTPSGFTTLGIDEAPPIIARGVLLDLPALGTVSPRIGAEHLDACAQAHELFIQPGDVILVRTGSGALWGDPPAYLAGPGMLASASRWAAEKLPLAVGADNIAWDLPEERDPDLDVALPGHLILIVEAGIYIVENLMLEELAAEQIYEFTFVCLPLKFRGGTGSPVRPIAVV
jgi:kynurenine formamidase